MFTFGFKSFLEEDEKVLFVFRRPFVFLFWPVGWRLCLWAGIVFLAWFLYPQYQTVGGESFNLNYLWIILAIAGSLHVFLPIFYWYVNALLMTNESLIIIEWPEVFVRKSVRIDFHNLDEVTVERTGFQSFMLNYGNLVLDKINGGDGHTVLNISGPKKAARIIEEFREKHLDQKNFTEESTLKGLLSNMVQKHVSGSGSPAPERQMVNGKYETVSGDSPMAVLPSPMVFVQNSGFMAPPKPPFQKKNFDDLPNIEIEKKLDNSGGIGIELD